MIVARRCMDSRNLGTTLIAKAIFFRLINNHTLIIVQILISIFRVYRKNPFKIFKALLVLDFIHHWHADLRSTLLRCLWFFTRVPTFLRSDKNGWISGSRNPGHWLWILRGFRWYNTSRGCLNSLELFYALFVIYALFRDALHFSDHP